MARPRPSRSPQSYANHNKNNQAASAAEGDFDVIEETLLASTRHVEWNGSFMKKSMLPTMAFLAATLAVGSV